MSPLPENEFDGARGILWRYYDRLLKHAAEDIIQNKEEFEEGAFGNPENIIDNHYRRLSRISCLCSCFRSRSADKPKGDAPLSKEEFRCFGCGGVIRQEEASCSLCGWTWK